MNHPVATLVDPTEPEFRNCTRCDVQLTQHRAEAGGKLCVDCEGLNAFKAPRNGVAGGFPPIDPAYEVFVHFPTKPRHDQTLLTLEALKIPYIHLWETQHTTEVQWARGLFNQELAPDWPIVLITSHGQVVDFWEGFDLNRLNSIPAARAAAINPTEAHTSVPTTQEEAA
jgi:hypothetical protein